MNPIKKFSFFFLFSFILISCGLRKKLSSISDSSTVESDKLSQEQQFLGDLDEIKKRGKLIAITRYNANSYFILKGETMGADFELLKLLAKELGVDLEVIVPPKWNDVFTYLKEGRGDIIAANLTVTQERKQKVKFTRALTSTRQVLVQRKPANWKKLKAHEIEKKLIRNQVELAHKTIHVRNGSSYYDRLQNLKNEIGSDINIELVQDDLETEEIMQMVAEGRIEYTIADENIARLNARYFSNLDVMTPISFPQKIAWAVRPNSPQLLKYLNNWIEKVKENEPTLNVIYAKYHGQGGLSARGLKSTYYSSRTGKISPYDDLIQTYAEKINWDWRLLASLIFQESRFRPKMKSWAGAIGLMQVMPRTARQFAVKKLAVPERNIYAGTSYIRWLQDYWKAIPHDERVKFVLASYNVGQGHVEDARRLARKFGKDPNKWDLNTAIYIIKKSNRKYYTDAVVKYGFCRGLEPFRYVKEVLGRFRNYQKFVATEEVLQKDQ